MEQVEAFYEMHKSEYYRAFKSQADMFEFVHPELSKVYGISYYCSQYGYSIEEAAAFGDTTKDIEWGAVLVYVCAMVQKMLNRQQIL